MPSRLTARSFAAATVAAGCGLFVLGTGGLDTAWVTRHPDAFIALAVGSLLGELLPVRIPRRGYDEQITVSTAFSFALLLVGGLLPAIAAQVLASVIQDLIAGKPAWRIRFNAAQYSLSLAAALLVLELAGGPVPGGARPFTLPELPAVLLAAATFFLVNTSIVGTAVALYRSEPVGRYLRQDLGFTAVGGGVLLCVAPIVAITIVYSPLLAPLFALPMFAIYRAGGEASRSEHAARHDALTGLANRVAFHERATEVITGAGRPACVLLLDLNRFKEVNDTLGHRYGDLLLQRIAASLTEQVDESACLARLGGDEFAIVAPVDGLAAAMDLARRVAESLHTTFEIDGFAIDAEASVGLAMFPDDGTDVEALLRRADVAMYRAKETVSGISLYDERDDHHSPAKLALVGELRSALDTGCDDIVVWYQPLLDLTAGRITGLEALVRWEHPEHGLLSPAAFLDIAERSSLVRPLTGRVLDLALSQLRDWRDAGLDLTVSVNVSARVLTDHLFPEIVAAALARHEIPADRLRLEVTESVLMADPRFSRMMLGDLHRSGVGIAIDDFGTGYSSLAYLAELPVSEVKIDRSFVRHMADGTRTGAVVPSTIDLGHHLGLQVVAEGVEDPGTLEHLRGLGCDLAQGFHIARPMPAASVTSLLAPAPGRLAAAPAPAPAVDVTPEPV